MKSIKFVLCGYVIMGLFMSNTARGQDKEIDTQPLSWWCYFGTYRLTDKWGVWTELQLRRADFVNEWQQVLPRVGVNYHLRNNIIFTAGYAYLWTYPYGEQPIPLSEPRYEHRPWQQITLLHESGKVSFQHRYRLEQRFLQNWTEPDPITNLRDLESGFELQNRMRYRFLTTLPLIKDADGKAKLFATAYDEIFINFGNNIGFNLFDQNRLGATIGYQFIKEANLQVGYMNQFIQKSNGRQIENNHALTVFLTFNVDFRKG
jgi:Protein of unknown function (DUF2490)